MHSPLPWDILQRPLLQCGDFLSFIPAAFLYTLPPSLFFLSSSCQPPPLPRIQTSHKQCAIHARPKTLCHGILTSISGEGLLQSRGSQGGPQDPRQGAGGGLEKPVRRDPRPLMLGKVSKRRIHLPVPLGISFQVGSIIQEPENVAQSAFASLVDLPSPGTVAGRSDVFGAVGQQHLAVWALEVFSRSPLLSCVFLLCPKSIRL